MSDVTPEKKYPDIFDEKKIDEILQIADRIDADEQVLMVIRQTKNPLKPGV